MHISFMHGDDTATKTGRRGEHGWLSNEAVWGMKILQYDYYQGSCSNFLSRLCPSYDHQFTGIDIVVRVSENRCAMTKLC